MKTKQDDGLEWLREIRRRMASQKGVKLYRREDHLAAVK